MRDDVDDGHPAGRENIIKNKKVEWAKARDVYYEHRQRDPDVPLRVRQLLAARLRAYYDSVVEYFDDKQTVKQAFQDTDLDKIPAWDRETVDVTAEVPGRTAATGTQKRTKLQMVEPEQMIEWGKQLDYITTKLGFGKDTPDDRPHGRIGGDERWE